MVPIRSFVIMATSACLGLSAMACTALTRPDEITISAEPLAGLQPKGVAAQPVAPANPAMANPAVRQAVQSGAG